MEFSPPFFYRGLKNIKRLDFIYVDYNYIKYLFKYDNRVRLKEERPYIGVLFKLNDYNYFAPLSSGYKKSNILTIPIDKDENKNESKGTIKLNNMIPIHKNSIIPLFINQEKRRDYRRLLQAQYFWCKYNANMIKQKAEKLYNKFIENKLPKVYVDVCCDFKLLEEKHDLYK